MVGNPAARDAAPAPLKACPSMATLTCGVPYNGDTTGELNKYSGSDYPGLESWGEYGPDVVHQLTVAVVCDLRIRVDPDPVTWPDLDLILIDGGGGSCDTVNWVWAGDHTIIIPDCPPGTYYIIVDGYTKEDYGRYTLTAACAVNLLVVDADGSGSSGPTLCNPPLPSPPAYCTDVWNNASFNNGFYKAALDGMSPVPAYTYWDKTANLGNLPPTATLNNSKSILWFSGRAFGDSDPLTAPVIITAADEAALAAYLNLGGRVVMFGQDILWDQLGNPVNVNYKGPRLPDGSLLNDYFQINAVHQDVWGTPATPVSSTCSSTVNNVPVWGVPGSPLGDNFACDIALYLTCLFPQANGAPFDPNIDALVSRFGEPAYDTWWRSTNTATTLPGAIRYGASLGSVDWFKTAFFAFSPECNRLSTDTTTVITKLRGILSRTLAWFEEDDSTLRGDDLELYGFFDDSATGNNNGIPDPGETFTFTLAVANFGAEAQEVRAYEGFEDWYTELPTPWCGDLGAIPAGDYATADFTMTLDPATPVGYRLQPLFNITRNRPAMSDTFEGSLSGGGFDLDGWTRAILTGGTNWTWSTAQSQSPTHSWFAADVGSVSDKVLISPPFTTGPATTLSFYHRHVFEGSAPSSCWDGGTLEYALAPGFNIWTVVPDAWFASGGFDGTVSASYGNPIGGKRAWCGSRTTWTQATVNLGSLNGNTVRVRWHEGDDNTTAGTGWWVDTVAFGAAETHALSGGFGTFVGQADVLLVKDEYWLPNTTGVDIYDSTIRSINKPDGQPFTTALWDTALFAAPTYANPDLGLENDWMRNYPFVVWFTGYDFAYTLLPNRWETTLGVNPEVELGNFLSYRQADTGEPARLILSSQDYLYEKYQGQSGPVPPGEFAGAYLKVSSVDQDYIKDVSTLLYGVDGVYPSERMTLGLNTLSDTGIFRSYADSVDAVLDETGTAYPWTYDLPEAHGGTVNLRKDRSARFAFLPFAVENIQDGTPGGFPSKFRFLERLMCQMLMTPAMSVPPCGYFPPNCVAARNLKGNRQGPDGSFWWNGTPLTNTAGDYIAPHYNMYGALNNPNRAAFTLQWTGTEANYLADQAVPPGSCFFYSVTVTDVFDQPAECP